MFATDANQISLVEQKIVELDLKPEYVGILMGLTKAAINVSPIDQRWLLIIASPKDKCIASLMAFDVRPRTRE